jgi:hypothetical protein
MQCSLRLVRQRARLAAKLKEVIGVNAELMTGDTVI